MGENAFGLRIEDAPASALEKVVFHLDDRTTNTLDLPQAAAIGRAAFATTPFGVRQFVAGTGGRALYPDYTAAANSEVFQAHTLGVLALGSPGGPPEVTPRDSA